jgi:hypothetical protein
VHEFGNSITSSTLHSSLTNKCTIGKVKNLQLNTHKYRSYMFRSTSIIRELVLNPAKVIFVLKHSVKLRRYILFGDVAACHRAECALCAVPGSVQAP